MMTVLPTPAPPNAPTLPPFVKGQIEIDDFDSGLENRRACILIGQLRRFAMNRIAFGEFHRSEIIDRIARDIENAAECSLAHRH